METTIIEILEYFVIAFHIFLSLLTIAVFIFIIYEWTKSNSIFRSSYFVILNFGYFLDTLFSFAWIYGHLTGYQSEDPLMPFVLTSQWHAQLILGLWDAILGFNRCTALGFPLAHKKIWNKLYTGIFILLIIIFPFVMDWYSFINPNCKFHYFYSQQCLPFLMDTNRDTAIVNIIFSVISIILILIGILKSPKSQSSKSSLEHRLIIQTLCSSASLALLYSMSLIATFANVPYKIFNLAAYFFYLCQFYPPIFILFFVSKTFRENFINFYKLNYIFTRNSRNGRSLATVRDFRSITT